MTDNFYFEIKRQFGVLNENPKSGWKKEVNLVCWNGNPDRIDIREWDPEHEHMSKGLTLSLEEAEKFYSILTQALLDTSWQEKTADC